jgi:hypothetical protein
MAALKRAGDDVDVTIGVKYGLSFHLNVVNKNILFHTSNNLNWFRWCKGISRRFLIKKGELSS